MVNQIELVNLGKSDLLISPMGIGTWAWGDSFFWGYGKEDYTDGDIKEAFKLCFEAGINFFDTAEVYGFGHSERILGDLIKTETAGTGKSIIVGTKFFPYPYRLGQNSFSKALSRSLARLQMEKIDLYQMHWPFPPITIETWMDRMADNVKSGLVNIIGVSNYSPQQMKNAYNALSSRGISLASNQVKYSILDRKVELNGLLELCQELGITVIAYSPLEMGMLTGKYLPSSPPSGSRRYRYRRDYLRRIQPVISLLKEIGQSYGGKSPAQISLNWIMCKGAIPIPGAKTKRQAQENIGALGWRLTKEEILSIEDIADRCMGNN